ncbi:transcriptional regulator [Photobacterium sanguinicancri]|uniref:Transcriptional regulator n=1 Tax=Photobacterium sanguinicancri TaxID=875932 RepID=A0AAW7Y1J6_9GAMM|nr:transcriptional regulator [Photobacterium sanguinicancri]MDO6542247.1 transcriptional regulator [Photobacterium sanguinicancri]
MHIGAEFLLAAIRYKIKKDGLCYSMLSEKMGIPLSTIKRHLHNSSLGLDKVLLYASQLNTDLVELSQLARQLQRNNEYYIRGKESDFFAGHPYLLDFIYMITARNMRPQEVADQYNLSSKSLRLYLVIAERLGYIEIHGKEISYHLGRRFIIEEGSSLDLLFKKRFLQNSISHDSPTEVCQGRVLMTQEQKKQLETEFDNKISEIHAANSESNCGEVTNVLVRFTPGQQIYFSNELIEIDSSLLIEVSKIFNEVAS